MRIIRDAIAWLRMVKTTSCSPVDPILLTEGRSSVALGTTAYGRGVDPASISESQWIAQTRQALFVAQDVAESQKLER